MPSKTSFFNKAIFKKTIKQNWPIWGSYLFILLLGNPVAIFDVYSWRAVDHNFRFRMAMDILERATHGGLILCAIYGIISASFVFLFLYNSRSAGFYASQPTTRKSLFFTQYMAGFTWLTASNAVTAVLIFAVQLMFGFPNLTVILQWFAVMTLYTLFFYSFGAFCCVLTGHGIVTAPLYAVLNFVAVVVETLCRSIISNLVYGYNSNSDLIFDFLSPVIKFEEYDVGYVHSNEMIDGSIAYEGISYDGWLPLVIYAAVGIAFAVLAYLIFKKRHMETASDIVAVNILKPAFRLCMGFGTAIVGGCFFNAVFSFFGDSSSALPYCLYMLISAFIGYFAAEMLIEKAFKVFKKKRWIEFAVICGVIVFAIVGLDVDLFGIESYIPDADNVESVSIGRYSEAYTTEDPAVIKQVQALHRDILANKHEYENGKYNDIYFESVKYSLVDPKPTDSTNDIPPEYIVSGLNVLISYKLENGRIVQRTYYIYACAAELQVAGSVANQLDAILNSMDAIRQRLDFSEYFDGTYANFHCNVDYYEKGYAGENNYSFSLTQNEFKELYETCIIPDMEAGRIGKLEIVDDYTVEYNNEAPFVELYIHAESKNGYYTNEHFSFRDPESLTFKYLVQLGIELSLEEDNALNEKSVGVKY